MNEQLFDAMLRTALEEALEALCRAAQAELAGRLRPEVRSEDCEDAFILACAWLALSGAAARQSRWRRSRKCRSKRLCGTCAGRCWRRQFCC